MVNLFKQYFFAAAFLIAAAGCQKMNRPKLGDFPKDGNPPGGPLKFYAAFDGITADPLRNAVDSIRATFAADNPLASVAGINGKGIKGSPGKDKAIKYPSANDFSGATSWSIAYWLKNVPSSDGEPEFHFSLASKDYWHESALFLLVEKGNASDRNLSTPDSMACKLAIEDNWIDFVGSTRLPKVLDNQWHHLVFAYDAADSKVRVYVDGALKVTSGAVNKNGSPRGAKPFVNTGNLVVGGWNKHAGLGGAQDPWIHSFTGDMDQFRLYSKTLTAQEVLALYNSKL